MRILVLGTGSIGRRHIANLQLLTPAPEFLLLREGGRQDDFSTALGAKVATTMAGALSERPDLAVIATPSHAHGDALLALLAADVACYIEKPIVTTAAQYEAVRSAVATLPALPPTLVGCNLRFLPSLQMLKKLIGGGAIGRPARAQLQVGQWLPDWRPGQDYRRGYGADPERGGGVVLDLIHELDIARFLFGEFDRVQAAGGRYTCLDIASEDAAAILLSRTSGPVVSVGMDYVARSPMRRYDIIGDNGTLCWDLMARTLTLHRTDGSEPVDCGETGFDIAATYRAAMRQLIDAMTGGPATEENLVTGLPSVQLALAANAAIRA
jgi:predicted dehydrogenase